MSLGNKSASVEMFCQSVLAVLVSGVVGIFFVDVVMIHLEDETVV